MIQEVQKNSEQSSLTSYSLWVEISKKSYFIGLIIVKSAFPSLFCILVSWYSSILVSWYPGILISWYPGILVSWYTGILVSWYPDILVS